MTLLMRDQENIEKGFEQGVEQGLQKGILQTALNLLREGLPLEIIAKGTGLSIARLEELRDSMLLP